MILKPFDPVSEALSIAGLAPKVISKEEKKNSSKIAETLESHGASVDDAARALGMLLRNADENTILRAVDLTFRAHGVLKEAEKPTMPMININIHGKEQRSLTQLITPQIVNTKEDFINVSSDD